MPTFQCDLIDPSTPLRHAWEHTVGSGHALLALRADWQQQLARCHKELGVRYVRFHGLLSDDVGILTKQEDELLYSFFNADRIVESLLAIGVRPFVELSFMPEALASGDKTVFHYKGNVTPPKDPKAWAELVRRLVAHWVERFGIDEVRRWYFEVWNEPNIDAFWDGDQAGYFELYRHAAEAIKGVDAALRVGGPATAKNAWVEEFLHFCDRRSVPADFVSTHSGSYRNADPLYDVGVRDIVCREVVTSPVRTSSLRSLGAHANVFAIESFVDELAARTSQDPVALRTSHLCDPRAIAVVEAAAAMAGGLTAGPVDGRGRGLGFARYKNTKAYVAVVAELDVDPGSFVVGLRQTWIAADAGEVIDPDGLVNQLEGGFVQAASWTLKERVGFDGDGVATTDWASYPILRFSEAPVLTTRLIRSPGRPALGAAEAVTGPAAAAVANAVAQATGCRIRDLPLTPDRIRAALAAA